MESIFKTQKGAWLRRCKCSAMTLKSYSVLRTNSGSRMARMNTSQIGFWKAKYNLQYCLTWSKVTIGMRSKRRCKSKNSLSTGSSSETIMYSNTTTTIKPTHGHSSKIERRDSVQTRFNSFLILMVLRLLEAIRSF